MCARRLVLRRRGFSTAKTDGMQVQIIFPEVPTVHRLKVDPVYQEFKRATLDLIDRGVTHFSARDVIGHIRWKTAARDVGEFKCNNNRTAEMARRFMQDFPEHDGFFQLRSSKYDDII